MPAKTKQYCGHCHECGAKLRVVLDGEEWCSVCRQYRRYRSHGWAPGEGGAECPAPKEKEIDGTP